MSLKLELILKDDEPSGLIACRYPTSAGWSGRIYKIPRAKLEHYKNDKEFSHYGIYFLFGEEDRKPTFYVGQAKTRKNGQSILQRITEHNNDFLDWQEAIVYTTTKDNPLGETELSYLENYFYNLAKNANRYKIKNKNEPFCSKNIEESEWDESIRKIKIAVTILGHKVFEQSINQPIQDDELSKVESSQEEPAKTIEQSNVSPQNKENFLYGTYKDHEAFCRQDNEEYTVLRRSHICLKDSPSCPELIKRKRKFAPIKKIDGEFGELLKEQNFTSKSSAAAFVTGYSINGKTFWQPCRTKLLNFSINDQIESINNSVNQSNLSNSKQEIYYLQRKIKRSGKTTNAQGRWQDDKTFVVLKGSLVELTNASHRFSEKAKKLRKSMLKNSTIDVSGRLQKDVPFDTPSAAAEFVIGGSADGWVEWKTKEGKTLNELQTNKDN